MPTKEVKAETGPHPVTAELKINKCSKPYKSFYFSQESFFSSNFFSLKSRLAFSSTIYVFKVPKYDLIILFIVVRKTNLQKSTLNRIIILYSKYVLSDGFIFDFAWYLLWNMLNPKKVTVHSSILVVNLMSSFCHRDLKHRIHLTF